MLEIGVRVRFRGLEAARGYPIWTRGHLVILTSILGFDVHWPKSYVHIFYKILEDNLDTVGRGSSSSTVNIPILFLIISFHLHSFSYFNYLLNN